MMLFVLVFELSAVLFKVTVMDDTRSREVRREIVRNGRTYAALVEPTSSGRVQISVTSSVDGEIVSEMSGVVAPEDFGMFGKIFRPEFAAMAQRKETRTAPSKMEERRQVDPNFGGTWNAEDRRQILAMHRSGDSVEQIANAVGRSVNAIRMQLRRMGVRVAYE